MREVLKLDLFVRMCLLEMVSGTPCCCELCPERERPALVSAQSLPLLMRRLVSNSSGHLEEF